MRSHERYPDEHSEKLQSDETGLCCCKVESLVADRGKVSAQGSGAFLAVLHAYAEAVTEYQVRLLTNGSDGDYCKVMKSEDIMAQVCERCRRVKSI